jgi:hypothetical protein
MSSKVGPAGGIKVIQSVRAPCCYTNSMVAGLSTQIAASTGREAEESLLPAIVALQAAAAETIAVYDVA